MLHGKSTLFNEILEKYEEEFVPLKKKTTRMPRESEIDNPPVELELGVSEDEVRSQEFVYDTKGNLYGFSGEEISNATKEGKILLGIASGDPEFLKKLLSNEEYNILPVFVSRTISDFEEKLRLAGRSEEEIQQRLSTQKEDFNNYINIVCKHVKTGTTAIMNGENNPEYMLPQFEKIAENYGIELGHQQSDGDIEI